MRFPEPLVEARLVRRYKRFLADVEMPDGAVVTVHCANPGAMLGLAEPGMRILLSRSPSPTRKLPWSWEIVEAGGAMVGINTGHPNRLVAEAIAAGGIPELAGYPRLTREVAYGRGCRVDLLLSGPGLPDLYVEVKNVHLLRRPALAEFPDSVTARGTRHLAALAEMVAAGHRAAMLYLIQRADAERFAVAGDVDPVYAAAHAEARAQGVEMLAYRCTVTPEAIAVSDRVPIEA